MHNFILVSSTRPKFRKKLMIEFQENAWTDRRIDAKTEGWTDPILLGLSDYCQGSNNPTLDLFP